jgi:hypothetical protein
MWSRAMTYAGQMAAEWLPRMLEKEHLKFMESADNVEVTGGDAPNTAEHHNALGIVDKWRGIWIAPIHSCSATTIY